MIFRSPFFPVPFLLAWHSVLDLHRRGPDKEKRGYCFLERGTFFSSSCGPPQLLVVVLLLIVV